MLDALTNAARELRSVGLAGSVWTLELWVVLRHQIDPAFSESLLADTLKRFVGVTGATGLLLIIAASTLALGTASQQIFRAPTIWIMNATGKLVAKVEQLIVGLGNMFTGARTLRKWENWETIPVDLARRSIWRRRTELEPESDAKQQEQFDMLLYAEVDRNITRVLTDPQYRDSYIRHLDSLAMLRMSSVVPLLTLGITAAIIFTLPWAVLSILALVIAFQGIEYRRMRDVELEAMAWNRIDLQKIREAIG